ADRAETPLVHVARRCGGDEAMLVRMSEAEVLSVLKAGLENDADRGWFRPGCAPLAVGHGFVRQLAFRRLGEEDVDAVAELLLREGYVPDSLLDNDCDAAHELPILCELPGRAILETRLMREETGEFVVMVEIARALEFSDELDLELL